MKGKAIEGILMAVIMVVSVLAATVPMVSAASRGDTFNYIVALPYAQKVLIGQNLQFEGFSGTVTISRIVAGDIENVYVADYNNRIYNVNWPTSGAYYVNYRAGYEYDAQLAVEKPDIPLKLKVGTRKVSTLAVGTNLIVDTGGMNLFGYDQVDLVVIGPDDQIKHDEVNNQHFTDITVSYLVDNYGSAANTLETSGWTYGDYTFTIETDQEHACGLEAASAVKPLKILKGTITIDAETTSTVELDTLKLTVTGVADDPITVASSPLSKNVLFKEGIDDTPTGANYHTNWFTSTIDADGIRRYAVEFNDTGTYTIKVTVTGTGDRAGDSDTVDITVLEKEVTFDLPAEVVIGDKIHVRGTSTSGTYVSVYVDDTLYKKLVDIVIEDGEFDQEVKTTDVGMDVPGSVRLKAWIDCKKAEGQERPTRSPDGESAILLSKPTLTAELSVPSVALEDDFSVLGTAKGQTEVTILSVPPKGGGGKSLLDKGQKGLSPRKASVSTTDDTFSKKMTVQEDATAGYYDIYVLCAGMDGEWGRTGQYDLEAALNEKYHIPSLTSGIICTKTQDQVVAILDDLTQSAGSDDLMQILTIKVGDIAKETLTLNPIADVVAGDPLVVTGETSRKDGSIIWITVKRQYQEIVPEAAIATDKTFSATFDTTGAQPGTYTVKANDGYGYTTSTSVNIIAGAPP